MVEKETLYLGARHICSITANLVNLATMVITIGDLVHSLTWKMEELAMLTSTIRTQIRSAPESRILPIRLLVSAVPVRMRPLQSPSW